MEVQLQSQPQQLTDAEVKSIQSAFITKVYGWMSLALTLTGLIALYTAQSEFLINLIFGNQIVFFGLIIGELALVVWMTGLIRKTSVTTATILFIVYSVLNGLTLSAIFMVYTFSSIASTFFITAGTFAVMSVVGYFTKTDLTGLGKLLMMALIGFLIATVINIFFHSETMYWFITYIGVAIFVGLIAYDTQKLKEMAVGVYGDQEMEQRGAVMGALSLYLDFINLFLLLLRIFGSRD